MKLLNVIIALFVCFNSSILISQSPNPGINKSGNQEHRTKDSITKLSTNHQHRFPPLYFEYKIEELDKNSPIKLDYNADVQKYIDLYLDQRSDKISEFLGLSELYFPIFEEHLDKYNLPLELKYLPIIESGLDPRAQSVSGAMGLWQLLYNASKLLGLEVSSYKDERCDPYLATDAACRYIKYLFSIFNDWQLALAAYNGGPGEVRNAIIRSGGKTNFWEIQPYLSEQTKWYVPAFIAIVYLYNHANDHGIVAKKSDFNYANIDTLMLQDAAEFSKIAEKTGISIDDLRALNPCYRRDFIPSREKPQSLVMPKESIETFLKLENQIYSHSNDTADYYDKLKMASDTVGLLKVVYEVKKGDILHKIALENNSTIENIKLWNQLETDNLKIGQKIVLWLPKDTANSSTAKKSKFVYYKVRKGETIKSIAEMFKCDSIKDIKQLNDISIVKNLEVGQQLKIRVNVE
jgi:membrane-bound lytic murein transglycosylase D